MRQAIFAPRGTLADPVPHDSTACMAMLRLIVAVYQGSTSVKAMFRQLEAAHQINPPRFVFKREDCCVSPDTFCQAPFTLLKIGDCSRKALGLGHRTMLQ